ncbi:hypothetical protein BHE74_00056151 [Ensete ventricosum]|nr:hypothetical protein BHE74_00056151 [Ensete ventricosum]
MTAWDQSKVIDASEKFRFFLFLCRDTELEKPIQRLARVGKTGFGLAVVGVDGIPPGGGLTEAERAERQCSFGRLLWSRHRLVQLPTFNIYIVAAFEDDNTVR